MRPLLIILNTFYMGIPLRIPIFTLKKPPESRLNIHTNNTRGKPGGKSLRPFIAPLYRSLGWPRNRQQVSDLVGHQAIP
jgi:hypothetical protein